MKPITFDELQNQVQDCLAQMKKYRLPIIVLSIDMINQKQFKKEFHVVSSYLKRISMDIYKSDRLYSIAFDTVEHKLMFAMAKERFYTEFIEYLSVHQEIDPRIRIGLLCKILDAPDNFIKSQMDNVRAVEEM